MICDTPLSVVLFFSVVLGACMPNQRFPLGIDNSFFFLLFCTFLFRFLFELNYTLNMCVFVVAATEHYLELVWIFSRTHTILSVVCLFETFVYQFGASVVFVECSLFIIACVCVRPLTLTFSHTHTAVPFD